MNRYFAFIFFAVLIFLSCKENEHLSPYEGNWNCNYSGVGDNGTFKFAIDPQGYATGVVTSIVFSQTFNGTGFVTESGELTIIFGVPPSGGTYVGTLLGTTAAGTWKNNLNSSNYSGTWNGNKQ